MGLKDSQPVEALDGGGGGAGALLRGAVVGEHGAADQVGVPVDARNADAVVASAGDHARRVRAVALDPVRKSQTDAVLFLTDGHRSHK